MRKTIFAFLLCCAISLNAQAPTPPQRVFPDVMTANAAASVADAGLIGTVESDLTQDGTDIWNLQQTVAAPGGLSDRLAALEIRVAKLEQAAAPPSVIHFEAEKFMTASNCVNNSCVQTTTDTTPPAVGNQKVVLVAGMSLCYNFTPPGGNYVLTVRLNGIETLHFEDPQGVNVSGPISNVAGAQGTFTAPGVNPVIPSVLALPGATQTGCWIVDSVGSAFPSINWFELTAKQ
jgi:hypothetical protein